MSTASTRGQGTSSSAWSEVAAGRWVRRSLSRWLSHQDPAHFRTLGTVEAWLGAGAVLGAMIVIAAWLPVTSDYIQLRGGPALACLLLNLATALPVAYYYQKRPLTPTAWYLLLFNSIFLQFFVAGLVGLAGERAAPAFAFILLVTAASHGFNYRFTVTEPVGAVGTAVAGLLAGLLFARTPSAIGLLALIVPASIFVELSLGRMSLQRDADLRERERLREAIQAQAMHDQSRRIEALSESLVDLLGRNHDLRNISLSVSTNAHVLAAMVKEADARVTDDLRETVLDLDQGVRRLVELFQAAMAQSAGSRSTLESAGLDVDFLGVIQESIALIASRYPTVRMRVVANRSTDLHAMVYGGIDSVFRIVQNLLINACEGDGQVAATEVTVRCWIDSSGTVLNLEVADNGPGFDPEHLAAPHPVFRTTKLAGTGLGLYIVERSVAACGGRMYRSNAPGSGAVVRLEFPRRA